MLTFAARMRMNLHGSSSDMTVAVHERVMELLHVMELVWCKDRVITERPSMRGTLGGELRRLSIAVEFIALPPVLVLQDPTTDLDSVVSSKLVECLLKFAANGHTVVSSFPKPTANVFNQFHKVVLSSQGHTIYASYAKNLEPFFCSQPLNYHLSESIEMIDFVMDIAGGVERPRGSRKPIPVDELQVNFEASQFFERCELGDKVENMLPKETVPFYGYKDAFLDSWRLNNRTWVIFYRAFYVKLKETEILHKSFMACCSLGLFLGYFMWNLGNFGEYCLSLLGSPYNEVSSLSACLFIVAFIIYGQQVMNVHIICQKMISFRHERRARCTPTLGFLIAMFLSEAIFVVIFALLFANIIYWMSSLGSGFHDYLYIMGLYIYCGLIGLTTTLAFTAVIRREILVRDLFLLTMLIMAMTAGFLFTLNIMKEDVITLSNINPFRWVYTASMVWKYGDYVDGPRYLAQYGFNNFRLERIWFILTKFIIFDFCLIFVGLLPRPITLHRFNKSERAISLRDSTDKKYSEKLSGPIKPSIFMRESSITSKRSLASQGSQQSKNDGDEVGIVRGPNVTFKKLCYRVSDRKSPFGYKHVLHPMNGRFEWGKLSAIMGAPGSGKSSLLHVLGGQMLGTAADIGGSIFFDDKPLDVSLLPWQHCAFVENIDEHYRDLTVRDVLTYAMQLRTIDLAGAKFVEENVVSALDLLDLIG
jgi:ABC-type multidrug transport system ATPase subunit